MDKYIIKSAEQCFIIMNLLGHPVYNSLTEEDIAIKVELSRNQVFRCLKTMEKNGICKKSDNKWFLSPEIIRFADGFRRHLAQKKADLIRLEEEFLG